MSALYKKISCNLLEMITSYNYNLGLISFLYFVSVLSVENSMS
nr:hypothetical protein BAR15_120151 [Bartonella sp. AR 15-3]